MKTLITLSVLQTIGIAALVGHVFHEEQSAAVARPVAPPTAAIASDTAPIVDEEWLRRIIREELAQQHNRPATEHNASAAQPKPPRAATATDVQGFCETENPDLIQAIADQDDYSFVVFSWTADGVCRGIGNSTQSFYIPK